MKVFVTGASGLLGGNFCFLNASRFHLSACFHQHPVSIPGCDMHQINLADYLKVEDLMSTIRPDVVVHAAAFTNVDQCEGDEINAKHLNVDISHELAKMSKKMGSRFILISTDSVFGQASTTPFKEEDTPSPRTVYSKTKLEGELRVREVLPDAVVIRTAFYGCNVLNKFSLGEWVVDRLGKGERISGFQDLFFSPIVINDLCQAINACIDKNLKGLYHIGSTDYVSKYEFAKLIALEFGLRADLIEPARAAVNNQLKASRPPWTVLNVEKFKKDSGFILPSVREGIKHFKTLFENQYSERLKKCNQ